MVNAYFCSNFLFGYWFFLAEKMGFLFGGKMKNVQACARFFSQFYGFGRRNITSFLASNFWVKFYGNVFTVFLFIFFQIFFNGSFIFAMCRNEQFCFAEDFF